MPTVFIPQVPSRLDNGNWVPTADVTPAKEFGELRHIMPMGMNIADPDEIVKQLDEGLENFSDGDFLLLLGDPIVIAVAAAIVARNCEVIQLLKWDRRMQRYFAFTIDLS